MSRVSRVSWVRANCLIWKLNFYANWYFDTYKEGISLYVNSRYKTLPNNAEILNKKISKISKNFYFKNRPNFWKKIENFFVQKINSPKWCRWNTYTRNFCPRFTLVIFSNRTLRVSTGGFITRLKSELCTPSILGNIVIII